MVIISKPGKYFQEGTLSKETPTHEIHVSENNAAQSIVGFGGAFTDSSAYLYARLNQDLKKEFIDLCFSKEGLAYNLGRVSIGSCDFSHTSYDYAQKDDLSDFSLEHDHKEIIPLIEDAEKHGKITLMASPWSPPARYKDNGEKYHGGHLKDDCYDLFADYLARYLKEMEKCGHPVEFMSVQNEQEAIQVWESCLYDVHQEARLIRKAHERCPAVKILAWDHNRDGILRRSKGVLEEPDTYDAVYGIAYHWYDRTFFEEIAKVHALYPDKVLLFSEGCVETIGQKDFYGMGTHSSFVRYAKNYLKDINNGSSGFIDWNLLLDEEGGYNHVGNLCEAPIMTNLTSLKVNPSYYGIKHLSHFVKKGAKAYRIDGLPEGVSAAALVNPDGKKVFVILNEAERKILEIDFMGDCFTICLDIDEMATWAE